MNKIIFTFFVFLLTISVSYAEVDLNDENKSIRELKENITELDKSKTVIIDEIRKNNPIDDLTWYFNDNLTSADLEEIKNIINVYIKRKNELYLELENKAKNLDSTDEIKSSLLEEKKFMYKSLLPYISTYNYDNYLEYIKSETTLYNEKTWLESDIIRKNEIISNKVEILEEKIIRHKSYIEDSLRIIVNERMEQKLEIIRKNPKFIKLSYLEKIEFLDNTINKIDGKINELEELWQNDSYQLNNKKISIYILVKMSLINFKENIKE